VNWVVLSRFNSIASQNTSQSIPIHTNTHGIEITERIEITEQGLSWNDSGCNPIETNKASIPFNPYGLKITEQALRDKGALEDGLFCELQIRSRLEGLESFFIQF
jgi:hypothetical protein